MFRLFVLSVGLLFGNCLQAQSFYGGTAAGGMMYHGDLSSKPMYDIRSVVAASGHIDFNGRFSLFGQYLFGHVGSSDQNNSDLVSRNLSFESHIFEWSLGLRVNILSSDRSLVVPYVHASAALYRAAPWTTDKNGNIVYLYPVHTQGNGLPEFPDRPEDKLIKHCFPAGAGISLMLTRRISLDLEGTLRYTFDDRLDDVGGYYPDLAVLNATGKARSDLTYRTSEIETGLNTYPAVGSPRGNPKSNDWYSSLQIRLRVKLFGREDPTQRRPTLLGNDMWMY